MKVAVIMGGKSQEREISLKTGNQIRDALLSKNHEVVSFDLDDNLYDGLMNSRPDVVYIALHGKYGEDGCLQGMLEIMGIPYVGSGVLASALAMNKIMAKKIFEYSGIPTPKSISFSMAEMGNYIQNSEAEADNSPISSKTGQGDFSTNPTLELKEFLAVHGLPVIVKPNKQGSTIGLTVVRDESQIAGAIEHAFKFDDEVIIEEYISGVELTVGIIGNKDPVALPVIEIVSETGLYDYTAKYTKGLSHHIIPARVPEDSIKEAQRIALAVHRAIGCRGLSRVDIMLGKKDSIPYVLEINTLPGMTETSLVPDAARAVGIEFPDLVERLIRLALEPK